MERIGQKLVKAASLGRTVGSKGQESPSPRILIAAEAAK